MSRYLVKLTPMDTFFFGDESKFRKKKKSEKSDNNTTVIADYFQRSAKFPQQTTLLGAMRYFILQQSNLLMSKDDWKDFKKVKQLETAVGTKSFSIDNPDQTYGFLKSISPVYIVNKNDQLFEPNKQLFIDRDDDADKNEADIEFLDNKYKKLKIVKDANQTAFTISNYDEKRGLSHFLTDFNEETTLKFDDVFMASEKVGITKNPNIKEEKKKDKAFYKQVSYRMAEGFSFAFYAEFDDEFKPADNYLQLGAEKSPFRITFEEKNVTNGHAPELPDTIDTNTTYQVVFKSDTYIDEAETSFLYDNLLAIISTKSFRFFSSTNGKFKLKDRSTKYNLIERGSVIFLNEKKKIAKLLEVINGQTNFKTIGYNQTEIKTIKIN